MPIMATLLIMTMMTIVAIVMEVVIIFFDDSDGDNCNNEDSGAHVVSHRPVGRDKFIKAGDKELKKVPMFQLCIDIYSNAD